MTISVCLSCVCCVGRAGVWAAAAKSVETQRRGHTPGKREKQGWRLQLNYPRRPCSLQLSPCGLKLDLICRTRSWFRQRPGVCPPVLPGTWASRCDIRGVSCDQPGLPRVRGLCRGPAKRNHPSPAQGSPPLMPQVLAGQLKRRDAKPSPQVLAPFSTAGLFEGASAEASLCCCVGRVLRGRPVFCAPLLAAPVARGWGVGVER